jgi:Trichohyalin-plectin-homology domain
MAFRQTQFNPTTSQQFRITNGPGLIDAQGQISMPQMEENLAREMARMKMDTEKRQREIEKICAESPELRELQNKVKQAYLNKERATQVTEHQYRKHAEMVSTHPLRRGNAPALSPLIASHPYLN